MNNYEIYAKQNDNMLWVCLGMVLFIILCAVSSQGCVC